MHRFLSMLKTVGKFCLCAMLLLTSASAETSGEAEAPAEAAAVLADAALLRDGTTLYFSADRTPVEGTTVKYRVDDSIVVVTWKEEHDHCAYVYAEVLIADAGQFCRYIPGSPLVGGTYDYPTNFAQEVHAVFATTGDFYGKRGISIVVNEGTLYRADDNMNMDVCFVDAAGDLKPVYRYTFTGAEDVQAYIDENDIRFCVEFGPVLYDNGKQVEIPSDYLLGQNFQEYTRSAMCQLGPLHYLFVTAGADGYMYRAPTLPEFSDMLADTGCLTAYALDGGQTAAYILDGKVLNQINYGGLKQVTDLLYFVSGAE